MKLRWGLLRPVFLVMVLAFVGLAASVVAPRRTPRRPRDVPSLPAKQAQSVERTADEAVTSPAPMASGRMAQFRRALTGELLKVLTLRATALMLVAAFAIAAALAALVATAPAPSDVETAAAQGVLFQATRAHYLALIAGALLAATDFQHQSMAATLLAVPGRGIIIAAKGVAATLVGLGLGASAAGGALVGLPVLAARAGELMLPPHWPLAVLATVLGAGFAGAVGAAVGMLVRRTALAVVPALVWTLIIEPLVMLYVPSLGRHTFTGLLWSLSGLGEGQQGPRWGVTIELLVIALALSGAAVLRLRGTTD